MLSVIIVNYNCEEMIEELISSISHLNDVEIIVVDNSMSYKQKYKEKVCSPGYNSGFSTACNIGIQNSKQNYHTAYPILVLIIGYALYGLHHRHWLLKKKAYS